MNRVPVDLLRGQCRAILLAWGMSEAHAEVTADILAETDLRGIDSHGISMLPIYHDYLPTGKINLRPAIRVLRETPVSALIDADDALGHVPAKMGMDTAIEKCRASGVGLVAVRRSAHYGPAGYYTDLAAREGYIGVSTTSARVLSLVPTFAAAPAFGTNPISFAAPAKRHPPFNLDMATTTVAVGKLKLAWLHDQPIPVGWSVDERGRPLTDAKRAFDLKWMTPLGGTRELGSHKGYGLAAVVQILSATLSGAGFQPLHVLRHDPAGPDNLGHFFMAIDPKLFREEGAFEDDLDEMIDFLHALPRAEADQPVLVHGDPEYRARAERLRLGVPVPDRLADQIRAVCAASGAPFTLLG